MGETIIKLDADGQLTTEQFPVLHCMDELSNMIGNGCDFVEMVRPERLYSILHCEYDVDPEQPGKAIAMLADEEGKCKSPMPPINYMASWLYGADMHGQVIVGNVLFVGLKLENGSPSFCPLDDMEGLTLYVKLFNGLEKSREKRGRR